MACDVAWAVVFSPWGEYQQPEMFGNAADAHEYAAAVALLFGAPDVQVREVRLDTPRRQRPGAWCVHLDVSGAVVHESVGLEHTASEEPCMVPQGEQPLPRFVGHGLTRTEAVAAADYRRTCALAKLEAGVDPNLLEEPLAVQCTCGTMVATTYWQRPCPECGLYVFAPAWAEEQKARSGAV